MDTMNLLRPIAYTFSRQTRNLAAGALLFGLLAGAGTSQAQVLYNWTNTTGSVLNDPNAWNPVGGPGTNLDTATFLQTGTFLVPLTNNLSNIGSLQFGAAAAAQTLNLTLDVGTNTLAGLSGNTTSASGFVFGQQGTTIAFIAGGKILVTNVAASPSNARVIVGRNGPATVNLTNGVVVDGNLVIANGTGANGSKVVVSGPNSFWSNSTTIAVGNGAGTANSSLVISNSGSMTALSTIQMGNGGYFNSLLLDTGGRLLIRNVGSIGSSAGSSNNTATVQGGAGWDCGGQRLVVGNTTGLNNALIVGNNGFVTNASVVIVAAAGNSLVLSGGLLRVTGGVTNNSGTVTGFGSVVGNTVFTGTGNLSLGLGGLVGKLTFSNNLTLVSGTTTTIKLDKGQAGSNDQLNVSGTFTNAGTVTVNNVGAALVGGDTFKILSIGTQVGGFSFTNLPSLTGTLVWNTAQLGPQGTISVVLPPTITGPSPQAVLTNTDVIISTVVTGVPAPSLQWQLGGTNLVDGATGNGSTISGSASNTLTIFNAQVPDSGQYCLIASNSGGLVTNCMTLTVTTNAAAPTIGGPTDQNTILGHDAVFSATVAGIPLPTQQWQENGVDIPGATGLSITVTNVQFSQDGFVYSIIASNSEGVATNSAVLHVVVPPAIQTQPQSLVITNTQSASFTVVSTNGVPAPTYQWYFNNGLVGGATNATYTIASATPANAGAYHVIVANVAGSVTSTDATLTVNSTMAAALTPANSAVNVCYDTPLFLAFDRVPVSSGSGKIKIFNATNTITAVDTIDTGLGALQPRTIGGEVFNTYPVIITGTTAAVYPHLGVLSSNQTYYVTVDPGTFTDTNGALYVGITTTNAWRFTTKPNGPASPNNLVVAADGTGDFCTVQGAVDSLPANNTTYTLVTIRNGTYTELVDTRTKNHITFRGQSRTAVLVGYPNNNNNNGSTATRMAFKVNSDDVAIESMTVTNMTPKGGTQAEALMINTAVKRFIFYNADVVSFQDTILGNTSGTQCYFKDSLIKGDTDFIWGGMNAFFTNCELRCLSTGSHITQARTDPVSNGMSFVNCAITKGSAAVTNNTCDFGRTLGFPDGNVIFMLCRIDNHISGWSDLSLRDWEFGNSNITATAAVSYNGIQLTNGDSNVSNAGSATTWLYGWAPQLAPNILTNPVSMIVSAGTAAAFNVVASGIPDPSYQWLKDGTNIVGATSAVLTIPATVPDDAGAYSVIVSNSAGVVTSTSATLTIALTSFQSWQQQYFGCTACPQAGPNADPDGDGQSNLEEFLAGTNPTNSLSGLQIISTDQQGDDVNITWTTAGGRTNAVQATPGDGQGGYDTNFTDISGPLVIPGSGDATTNYLDAGGVTNTPARYYRIRLVP